MRSVLLIRHAKSSWENFEVSDFDRPLNDRGKRDAPAMADRLKKRGIQPDLLLVSTAKRTRKTADSFIAAWSLPASQISYVDELYLASPATLQKILTELPGQINNVAIISHNNGLTDFANELTDVRIDNIPTCGIFAIRAAIDNWSQFTEGQKEFWFFDYPKNAE